MYDKAENRVRCHQLATERREQNRPIWDKKINLRPAFDHVWINKTFSTNIEDWKKCFGQIATIIENNTPANWRDIESKDFDETLDEVIQSFKSGPDTYELNDKNAISFPDQYDEIITLFYDWADEKRYWIEPLNLHSK